MTGRSLRVATDVGGTFTDLVCLETDSTGVQTVRVHKTDSTPPDFERGVLDVLAGAGVPLQDVEVMAHGSTVVINALTERKGVRVGLLTTVGFSDVLEIARGNRPDFFNLRYSKPPVLVPRRDRRGLPGRMTYQGVESEPLDLTTLPAILQDFRAGGVQAVAICLLHAYANPAHERAVLDAVRAAWPGVSAVASHQITREWREYERTNTTVMSAYVQPVAARYLTRLAQGVAERGFEGRLYIMQSNCGVNTVEATREIPITIVESGPASGFWAAAETGRLIGEPNVLALDIGGTTAKCSLIEGGKVSVVSTYWIERDRSHAGYPIMTPVVDLVEIGSGGGSIAWVDDLGKLHVGPQSAGAQPGPVAYGRGGTAFTTTDANLALGRINPDYFCGGAVQPDMAGVHRALDLLAARLGVDPVEAARGVVRIANSNMINALKLVSVNRGRDPRDYTMMAFGGGGALHAAALAADLGVSRVVVPAGAAVFSAWGMLMADLRRDHFLTMLVDPTDPGDRVEAAATDLEQKAAAQFTAEGIAHSAMRFERFARFRYRSQENSVEVSLRPGSDGLALSIDDFHAAYEREYTYRLGQPVELVGIHIVAFAEVGKLTPAERPVTGRCLDEARKGSRMVDYALEGIHSAAVFDGSLLEPGMRFAGPAVIEEAGTTTVVLPGQAVRIDGYGNIHIQLP